MITDLLATFLSFSLISVNLIPADFGKTCQPEKQKIAENYVIKGSISSCKELPSGFYGIWSVASALIETNNEEIFRQNSLDLWQLSKDGNIITLSNPVSGATASITVENVKGNKASFFRDKITPTKKERERAEITIEGDTFYGYDTLTIEYYQNGNILSNNVVKYKVTTASFM